MANKKEHLGIIIDYDRDKDLPEQSQKLLSKYYCQKGETSPQEAFARASVAYCMGDMELAQRIYDAVSRGHFMFASPVLSNAPLPGKKPKALPISCFLTYVEDSLEGLIDEHTPEVRWLSVKGGGVGGHWSDVRSVSDIAPGPMPFLHTIDADMTAYRQGRTRKGSYAAYLDVSHPEIVEFVQMRIPTGDVNRKNLNLHHGVNLSDKFMRAVENDETWQLVDPHDGSVRDEMPARRLWELILETRYRTGEPYLNFIDTANRALPEPLKKLGLKIHGSNLCVTPETGILTNRGYLPIAELVNKKVKVWNGKEFSETVVRKTGVNQKIIKIVTDSGQELECTEYHNFYLVKGYGKEPERVSARDLKPGDRLIKFDLPVIEGSKNLSFAYQNGFFTGDGTETKDGRGSKIYLYGKKMGLLHLFEGSATKIYKEDGRISVYHPTEDKFFVPDSSYTVKSRLDWLAGWLDADGCVYRNGDNEQIVAASINKEFLIKTQLMLQTLGVHSKVQKMADAGKRMLPANDGSLQNKEFDCKEAYRLIINSSDSFRLLDLGLSLHRLEIKKREPQREASHFIKIQEVRDEGRISDTYCFTEEKRNMGMFNGLLTGNCNEIHLPTGPDRTAVCCLSSLNLEKYDEWKKTGLVRDLIRFLDNVLEVFIQNAPDSIQRARYSAQRERSLGLGAMGLHSLFQKNMVAFESKEAKDLNEEVFSFIKKEAVKETKKLGKEKGEAPDMKGSGRRNSHLLAIAPNANSSNILGCSPSIEKWKANAFTSRTRVGSDFIQNKYLKRELAKLGKDTEEVWSSITTNGGSVQHLDFLPQKVKEVFKTAIEIDQMKVIELAADRQRHLCQGQSLNVFFKAGESRASLHKVHFAAWKLGCKGMYYLRTEASNRAENVASKIERVKLQDFENKGSESDECVACEG